MNPSRKQVVVIGAGCAGLASALKLLQKGHSVLILEKLDRVGGLAGGISLGGNIYEYGPHIFHTTDPEILNDVKKIAQKVLIPFHKTVKIKFLGKYFDFPLTIKDLFSKLRPIVVVQAALSLAFYFIQALFYRNQQQNCETALKRVYGDVLYRLFFKDYITKVWGIEPSGLSAAFAQQRIPRFDFLKFWEKLKKLFLGPERKAIRTDGYVEKTEGENFTTRKGFSLIAEAYAEEIRKLGGKIVLNADVQKIHLENDTCKSVSYSVHGTSHEAQLDECISTAPINILPRLVTPPRVDLNKWATNLHFRGIVFVAFLIKRSPVLPASFMYFREVSFNRITDLSWFQVEVEPKGSTIVIAEITCQPEDQVWRDDEFSISTVKSELLAEGLIQESEIIESHVFKVEHGYPIYKFGFEENLKNTLEEVAKIKNLHTTGRQGKFAYVNTHVAIKMGYELAEKIST